MKQTAVEWLISELRESKDFHRVINELNQRSSAVRHILNEAQQMEKEQSFEIFKAGQESMEEGGQGFDQYYNENFRIR